MLALVVAATAVAPAAAATTHPDVGRLWHDFPLGRARLAHPSRPQPPPRVTHHRPKAPRPPAHRAGILSAVLAGSATALTVIGVIGYGRRRGWTGRPAESRSERDRRAGAAPHVLAFYAVAAAVGVIVGLLIPLIS
ncbi:MAG TPA: hypothetical protein VN615_15920 [Gaiellales bacterium]|nr:hypothetical protein [Gaiellales bacterium]